MSDTFVIDLFCGAGGFSEGARQAGANVILAVDCWQDALKVHEANHPETAHWCEELGGDPHVFAGRLDAFINEHVPVNGHVHIHASPPCQNLCGANHGRSENEGFRLVDWTFEVIDIVSPDTYTLEQVSNPRLLRHHHQVPNRVYDMSKHGIPQSRRRVIFGMCPILPVMPLISLKTVLDMCGYVVLPEDEQSNGQLCAGREPNTVKYHTRRLDDVAYTVTSRAPVLARGARQVTFPHAVRTALQTFPQDYFNVIATKGNTKALHQMIANSVPPKFAKLMMSQHNHLQKI